MTIYNEDIKQLVITRLELIPENVKLFIGNGSQGFSKEELINHVTALDDVGKEVIEVELEYLRSMKDISKLIARYGENPGNAPFA